MSRQWTWYRPASLDEAVGLLLEHGADAMIVAGGTAVCLNPPRRERMAMIDLQRLGLDTIEAGDDRVRIGAGVTAQQLAGACELDCLGAGMLRTLAASMGPRPVRNRVTLGGNVMQVFRWCDLPVALLALGASFELSGPSGTRVIEADALMSAQPRRSLEPGELLSAITVEADGPARSGAFVKLSMTTVDHALASAGVRIELDEAGVCRAARVAVGALTVLPQRAEAVEVALVGQSLDADRLEAASAKVDACEVTADRRADADYLRQVAAVLVRRALETAIARGRIAKAGGGAC